MRGIYLLHLDRPLSPKHTAQHYKGSAEDIEARVEEHRRGNGARIMQVAAERGIGFVLARVWECPEGLSLREAEKAIKVQKHSPRLCPICNGRAAKQKREARRSK